MKKILIVIDMQNDFVDGTLGSKEACAIVENVAQKIGEYDVKAVYATQDTHFQDYLKTLEGEKLPVPHCIKDSDGWHIKTEIEDILKFKKTKIFEKQGFGSYELIGEMVRLYAQEPCEFEIIGLCTDICVITNALMLRAALPQARIKVDSKCVAGTSVKAHEAALASMQSCQIDII